MTKKKELPSALRNQAIGLIRGGHKISEISHILHINISTLHYLVRGVQQGVLKIFLGALDLNHLQHVLVDN